jgi:hypothetical protein
MGVPLLRAVPSSSVQFDERWRAGERTRTADLLQLRVIHHALLGFAQPCKYRIS